jgi:O-antigen/teichoic acid export membrane protein
LSLRAKAVGGAAWASLEVWGRQLLGLAVFTLLARLLDREAFGLVALAGVYIAFIQMFVTQGFGEALVQRKELKSSHLDTAFWVNIVVAIVLAVLTITFRHPLAVMLKNERVAPVLAWLAVGMPLMALTVVPGALLTREMKFRSLAVRTTLGTTVGGCVGVALALFGFGAWSLVAQQLVGTAVGAACLWSSVSWRPGVKASRTALADIAPFSGGVLGNSLLWFISKRVDQTVIGTGLGVISLGAYAIAQRVVSLGTDVIASPAQSVAMPAFSKMQDEPERLGRTFVRLTSLLCVVALPTFLGMLLLGPRLIPAVLGSKWGTAIVPMQILCAAGMLRTAQTFAHPIFMALGRVGLYTWIFALDAAVSAVGCWLASTHGVGSVAWAVVAAAGVAGLANFFVISRLVTLSFADLFAATWPILVACGTMSVAVLGTEHMLDGRIHELILLVMLVLIGIAAYGVTIALLAREFYNELWDIVRLMRASKRTT